MTILFNWKLILVTIQHFENISFDICFRYLFSTLGLGESVQKSFGLHYDLLIDYICNIICFVFRIPKAFDRSKAPSSAAEGECYELGNCWWKTSWCCMELTVGFFFLLVYGFS